MNERRERAATSGRRAAAVTPEELGRRLIEALTHRDWDAYFELLAPDCRWEDVPTGRVIHGPSELVNLAKGFVAAFPDLRVEVLSVIAQGDLVAIEWRGRGTHTGTPIANDGVQMQPTGRSFVRDGVGIARIQDGKVISYRDHFDRLQMAEQVGW